MKKRFWRGETMAEPACTGRVGSDVLSPLPLAAGALRSLLLYAAGL